MANEILRPEAPALPQARPEYNRNWQDQYNNVLRLFFNRLVGTVRLLLGVDGGASVLYFPLAKVSSTSTQTIGAANTPTPVTYNVLDSLNSASVVSSSRITLERAGVYSVNFAANVTGTGTLHVWIRVNGVDVPNTYNKQAISADSTISVANVVTVSQNDYVEVVWADSGTGLSFTAAVASTPYPAQPSVTTEVQFVGNG